MSRNCKNEAVCAGDGRGSDMSELYIALYIKQEKAK
jgi:hypothetical protein